MSRRSFIGGVAILMIAGFIVRILGFIFRIYLSNIIGAEGMGVFQLVAPIYSLIILTLTSGISIAVSKMIAAELSKKHLVNLVRITRIGFLGAAFGGILFSIPMFIGIDFIVNVLLKDSRTYYAILLLIPVIPIIAATSALKGYFYGIQDVTPTAVSQIVEQLVKIGLILAVAGYIAKAGIEFACAVATVGMAVGEISNLIVLWVVYRKRSHKNKVKSKFGLIRKRSIAKEIASVAFPVSFNRFITSILNAAEQLLIPRRLLIGGLNYQQSIEAFGRLSGMAMPLIYFPCLVTSSLATTLVPVISEAISLNNFKTLNHRIDKSIQITFILGFIFMAVFYSFPKEIGDMLYKNENIGPILFKLSFTCVFIYLQQTLLGILNGLGKQVASLYNSLAGSGIRIGFLYFLVPYYGMDGYFAGLLISSIIVCALNLAIVVRTTGMTLEFGKWIVKPAFACFLLIVTSKYIISFFSIFNLHEYLTTFFAVISLCFGGLLIMTLLGVLEIRELLKMIGIKK